MTSVSRSRSAPAAGAAPMPAADAAALSGEAILREFDDAHEQALRASFVTNQREQFWDL